MRAALWFLLLGACAASPRPAPQGGPRGLRASEHVDLARDYDEQARASHHWPDAGDRGDMRWARTWDSGAEHERLAAIHRGKAAQLHAAYEEACGARSVDDIAVSPLQRWGTGGTNTPNGVLVYLDARAGGPDKLLADLRCHRAWMMLAPAGMEACPLDLAGLVIDARGDSDGIVVSLSVRDPKLVPELQRRAAHDLESAVQVQRGAMH
ncbi:MAG: hypothetical protein JNL83_33620 [Myxococcales bacterium]|nr:hypothetical protein [Myxococcales bacterium]